MIVVIRNTDIRHRLFGCFNALMFNVIAYCDGRHVILKCLFPILDH